MSVELNSVVACPSCGVATSVQMPTNACQFFWVCPGCGERLRPAVGGLLRFLLLWNGSLPTQTAGAGSALSGIHRDWT